MNRRTLLARLGAVGAASLAGCLGPDPGAPESPTRTDDPDPEATFEVTDRSCGNGANDAEVTFGDDAVRVDGVIGGSDTCDTAALDGVTLSGGTLVVRVTVRREETSETPACAQCLTDIRYDATVRLDPLPETVEVVHRDGDGSVTVARATR